MIGNSNPLPDKKIKCHHTGFKMSCHEGVVKHRCPKWAQVAGVNPNTGEQLYTYSCVDSLIPILMIENSQQQRQTAAAVESFRNELVQTVQVAMEQRQLLGDANGTGQHSIQEPRRDVGERPRD